MLTDNESAFLVGGMYSGTGKVLSYGFSLQTFKPYVIVYDEDKAKRYVEALKPNHVDPYFERQLKRYFDEKTL